MSDLAVQFLSGHIDHRREVREHSAKFNLNLVTAHHSALNAVISYKNRTPNRIPKGLKDEEKNILGRMLLMAQFLQGVDITETAISEGLYAQAGNLLKQELETLTAIEEFRKGKRKNKNTPNIQNSRYTKFKELYCQYNEIAHPSHEETLEALFLGEKNGHRYAKTNPRFHANVFRKFYGNQATFFVMLFEQMENLFFEAFEIEGNEEEHGLVVEALNLLLKEKIIFLEPRK